MRLRVCLVICCFVVSYQSSAAGPWQGREEIQDGVSHIHNPGTPSEGRVTLNLEELWRVGGDSEEEGEFFGVIGDIALGQDGTVFLMDRQLSEIKIFSAHGTYLRTIGREGEGPGEFRRPSGLFLLPNGNLGISQMRGDFITVLDPQGNPQEEIPLFKGIEGMRIIFSAAQAGPNFMLLVMHQRMGNGTVDLVSKTTAMDENGNELGTYHEVQQTLDFGNPILDETQNMRPLWSTDAKGTVDIVSDYGRYAVHRFTPDGTRTRVVHRAYESLPRSQKEMEDRRSSFVSRGPVNPKIVVADHHPDIQHLHTSAEGLLWVLPSRGARSRDDGVLGVWDIYDSKGHFTHELTLKGEGDPLGDGLLFAGDKLFVIRGQDSGMRSLRGGAGEGDEEEYTDPMEVICYRIPEF